MYETVPELKEQGISKTTIHNLFVAPNKRNNNSKRYLSLIDAKVPRKKNIARISMRDQMVAMFKENICEYSCDDMNKLLIGVNAVSRYHQLRRFHLQNMAPNYSDHDFPYPGLSKEIVPAILFSQLFVS